MVSCKLLHIWHGETIMLRCILLYSVFLLAACDDSSTKASPDVNKSLRPMADEPDFSSWAPDGAPVRIAGNKQVTLRLTPLRGEALRPSDAGVPHNWCGVRIEGSDGQAQSLVLVGTGVTEALSCSGIQAVGRVPAASGTENIAFIYKGRSPNTDGVITAIVIERALPAGRWAVDEDLSYKLDENGQLTTIPAIRAWLARQLQTGSKIVSPSQ